MEINLQDTGWLSKELYEDVCNEIEHEWPHWKQKEYNDTFAQSKHAKMIVLPEE